MGIFGSMYIARSGMLVNETAIGVIGDNIAHLNTVGFKGSRANFADVFYRTVFGSGPPSQAGLGAQVQTIQRLVAQGGLLGTGVTTDLAVAGEGYFLVSGEGPTGDEIYYTRAGQFELDADGFLTTQEGLRVQGYPADLDGDVSLVLGDLNIADATSPPQATNGVAIAVNLDAGAPINPVAFDVTAPAGTSQFSTTVTVFDSQGVAHQVDVYFERTAANTWTYHAVVDGGELAGGAAGTNVEIGTGTLTFDANGRLQDETAGPQAVGVQFGNAAPQDITFDFGEELANGGDGTGSTQFAGPNEVLFLDQDGFTDGVLQAFQVDPNGEIVGTFSNGQTRVLGQLALAKFVAPAELEAVGDNLFSESELSGPAAVGTPQTDGRGAVLGGTLEQSNVDLSTEFTEMIISQRAFQASSRTITTADEMMLDVINLKR